MSYIIVFIIGIIESAIAVAALFFIVNQSKGELASVLGNLEEELELKKGYKEKISGIYSTMVGLAKAREVLQELGKLEESLKAERGRITITQAELETVETRLRELEEIERELEASGLETKEELKILQKKEAELKANNQKLRAQIEQATGKLGELMGQIELSSQVQEQIMRMKTELLRTEQKIDILMLQIEQGNGQYFILKQRYDALDIEYAQLYEKFSDMGGDE